MQSGNLVPSFQVKRYMGRWVWSLLSLSHQVVHCDSMQILPDSYKNYTESSAEHVAYESI